MVKLLIAFTSLVLLFTCCFLVSSQEISSQDVSSRDISPQNISSQNILPQDISYTYEEPIEGLILLDTYVYSHIGSLFIWMASEDKKNDSCMLPYLHVRVIDKLGQIKFIDLNYTFPVETACPVNMNLLPLKYNHILISYVKSINGVNKRYGLLINHSSEIKIIRDDIYLGDADVNILHSFVDDKGFIITNKPDEKGITTWRWFSDPYATTGKVEELRSGEFHTPKLSSYTLVDGSIFPLIDGGFGFMYILKYNYETKVDPNLDYWRIYVSFLREGSDSPTIPTLVYHTTEKLNNITMDLNRPCYPTYNIDGYVCILSLNNTITNKEKNESRTEEKFYQLGFLRTGAPTRFDLINNLINNKDVILQTSFYGGFIVRNFTNITAMNYYVLDDNGNYSQPGGSFDSEFIHYNLFRKNNTIFGIKQTGNKLELLLKPIPRLTNQGVKYDSPIIESTEPAINEVIKSSIDEITVKFTIPVKLSTANVSIFQLNDDPNKPDLLRQTISGDSKLCKVGYDNHTVHIPIFKSTFNQPNSTYYVVVENNFVSSQMRDEPLIGVYEKTWMFSTGPFKADQHSESVTGLLLLNEEGSSKFLKTTNKSEFLENMIQRFSEIIPVREQRLSTNYKWRNDTTSPQKIILSFSINEASDDAVDPSSRIIFDNLKTLIDHKSYTALSNNEYTSLIDESASFEMIENYFENFFPLIMIIVLVSLIVLFSLYIFARRKNPEGRNSAIIETTFVVQDFILDLLFTLLKVKNVPFLVTPNIIFFVMPIIINFLMSINIFVNEISANPSFVTWFKEYPTLAPVFTLFSALDIQVVNILSSDLFGLKVFSVPLTPRSKKMMLYGSIINIFIEDVPQLIIQALYHDRVVETFDLVSTLALISGGLVIGNKLILNSYHALVIRQNQRNKIGRENYNNEAEEEIDLADIGRDRNYHDYILVNRL